MSLLHKLKLARRQRHWRKLADNATAPVIAELYRRMPMNLLAPYREATFLAADLEMTGLDPDRDHIVSIGFVPIVGGAIVLGEARHILVASDRHMGESATIHHIRNQDLELAEPLSMALDEFLRALAGKILLLHHAPLDMAFLTKACEKIFNSELRVPLVDTLQLERQRLLRRDQPIGKGELRLFNCRERYHLPPMTNHNALSDALATAELFLAITAHKGSPSRLTVSDLVQL